MKYRLTTPCILDETEALKTAIIEEFDGNEDEFIDYLHEKYPNQIFNWVQI